MANFNTAVAQEQLIGYWLTTKGISKKTLETHPQIDDIILMLNIRHSSDWSNFNKSEEAVWGAIWGLIYKSKNPLTSKGLKKLENIITNSRQRIETHLQALNTQRQRIKQARQNRLPNQKDHDMIAKGSFADTSVPWEV